jgi:hypothetical protein
MIACGIKWSVKGLCQQQALKERKLCQLDKVLYKWFTAVCSKGKPITGPVLIGKAKSFYDEITDEHVSLRSSCKILKNQPLTEMPKWNTPLISCAAQVCEQ